MEKGLLRHHTQGQRQSSMYHKNCMGEVNCRAECDVTDSLMLPLTRVLYICTHHALIVNPSRLYTYFTPLRSSASFHSYFLSDTFFFSKCHFPLWFIICIYIICYTLRAIIYGIYLLIIIIIYIRDNKKSHYKFRNDN